MIRSSCNSSNSKLILSSVYTYITMIMMIIEEGLLSLSLSLSLSLFISLSLYPFLYTCMCVFCFIFLLLKFDASAPFSRASRWKQIRYRRVGRTSFSYSGGGETYVYRRLEANVVSSHVLFEYIT